MGIKVVSPFPFVFLLSLRKEIMEISEYSIVDVRTHGEFVGGHVAGSINIPLQEILQRVSELDALKQPIIFCCASGMRSGQATEYFKAKGYDCSNGGGWMEVNARFNPKP
jgi:phage shock protein E